MADEPEPVRPPTARRAEPDPSAAEPSWSGIRRELRAFAELFALTGFAVAQPLFDIFGKAPDRFVFRGATSGDIWAFALVVLLAAPLVLWAVEAAVQLVHAEARRWLHLGFVAALIAAFFIQVVRPLVSGPVLIAVGVVIGVLAATLYVRAKAMQTWLAFCSAAPPVFAALFLFASPTSQLLADTNTLGIVPERSRAPVVMIVFDELPLNSLMTADGNIDAELFPNFAALADDSHWFRNTTAISNFTWNAVPALVTGMLPNDGESPVAESHPKSIFTLLGESMDLKVTESITRLCPANLCAVQTPRDGGLGGLLSDARNVMTDRLAPHPSDDDPVAGNVEDVGVAAAEKPSKEEMQVDARSQNFIGGLTERSDALHYFHVLLPHIPFRYLPDGTLYEGPNPDLGRDGDNWTDQPALARLGRQRHLLQLGYADQMLGKAMRTMKDSGLYDDAVVVVVADHGASFLPGQEIRALDNTRTEISDDVKADVAWVPFFVKEPGQTEPKVSDADVRTIDVLPTIADVLDLTLPWDPDGRSALGAPRTGTTKEFHRAEIGGGSFLAGEVQTIDTEEGFDRVRGRAVDLFLAETGDPLRWWRIGPSPMLIGTEVEAADARLTPVDSALDPTSRADAVDLSSGRAPNLVQATVPSLSAGDEVVVAVNGTIWASTDVYDLGSGPAVAAIVPTEAFRDGANSVEVYAVG